LRIFDMQVLRRVFGPEREELQIVESGTHEGDDK
jgi:hypothetical protein